MPVAAPRQRCRGWRPSSSAMTRLMLGRTLERICKGVLLLCLLHFLIMMILYFDVYSQRFDLFSRFNNGRNGSRNSSSSGSGAGGSSNASVGAAGSGHHFYYYNLSRPNATLAAGEQLVASAQPEGSQTPSPKPLPPCPDNPPGLVGRLLIEFSSQMTMERVQRENPNVTDGGRYTPPDCRPRWKVAIIIPFRHRENHLKYWLHYLHPILRRQRIDYGIYIINQLGEETFNRAKLLNVGYAETLRDGEYDCFIFSDVDLIPMDDRNLYHCYDQPRHFAIAMDKFGFRLPYAGYFGGVSGLSNKQFLKINGFPNEYWGWGGEDDDIYNRITLNGMKVSRPDVRIGRYRMIKHERDKHNEPNPQRFNKIQNTKNTMKKDGISSLTYRLVQVKKYPLYTNISVEIGKPPPRPMKG
ncbi:beta-1,4-galactosyltransferase 2 [Pungitius pungitius]|uniref:beta-1,4-galactosyltransferase 2 n=1 Tax=Pungitius pungitius TaxID=134920 RepID=UPI002E0DF2F4